MAYVSYKTKRALGAKYSRPPEIEMEEKRLEQQYAMIPQMAQIRESKRQANMAMLDRTRTREAQEKMATQSGIMGTVGNVASLGMQAYKAGLFGGNKNTGTQQSMEDQIGYKTTLPIYTRDNPAPREVSPYWGEQAPPLNTYKYQTPDDMLSGMTKASYVEPSVSGIQPSAQTPNVGMMGASTAMSGLGAAGSALNAYNEFQEGDYVEGALDTAQAGIGMYNTGQQALNTINAAQGVGSAASSSSSVLPAVGAAINIGKGAYDTATSESGQEAVQGVWKMVDGVLQYVIPYYGMGRGISNLVKTGESLLGLQDGSDAAMTINTIQNIFGDPAGLLAGEGGDDWIKKGLRDSGISDTWICTATDQNTGMSDKEKESMVILREYALKEHNGWMTSYLKNGPILIKAISLAEDNLSSFYEKIRLILVEPVCKSIENDNLEEAYQVYLLVTKLLFKTYLPDFYFKEA